MYSKKVMERLFSPFRKSAGGKQIFIVQTPAIEKIVGRLSNLGLFK